MYAFLVLACLGTAADAPSPTASVVRVAPQGAPAVGLAGASVAVAGDLLVVGAPGSGTGASQVYVYRRPGAGQPHEPVATLVPENAPAGGRFGQSVAVDPVARLIAVGAPFDADHGTGSGAVYVFRENSSGYWLQTAKLSGSDTNSSDWFGWSLDAANVSATSTRLVVGAPLKTEGTSGQGAAYRFELSTSPVVVEQRLAPVNVPGGLRFGEAVTVDGGHIAVGAIRVASTSSSHGAVHLFEAAVGWSQHLRLSLGDAGNFGTYGWSLDLAGDRLAVGTPDHPAGGVDAGTVHVYRRGNGTWPQQQRYVGSAPGTALGWSVSLAEVAGAFHLVAGARPADRIHWVQGSGTTWPALSPLSPPDGATGTFFGESVAWDGATLVAGALVDPEAGPSAGAAYRFDTTAPTWTWEKLLPTHAGHNEEFGDALAIDGDLAVVGAPEDDDLTHEGGAAYVLQRTGGAWTQVAKLDAGSFARAYAFLGTSVDVSGDTVAVGAPLEGLDVGPTADGAAYVFRDGPSGWGLEARLDVGFTNSRYGQAVALEGEELLVGAPGDGVVDSLRRTGASWSHGPGPNHADAQAPTDFGASLAIGNGQCVVGGPLWDFPGRPDAGAAYVFDRTGSTWTFRQRLIAQSPEAGERFGSCLALDGDRLAIGAPRNDANGADAGAVYTYRRSGTAWLFESQILPLGGGTSYRFGTSVALRGPALAIGAGADSASPAGGGALTTYRFAGFLWTREQRLPDAGLAFGDGRGSSCAWWSETELLTGVPGRDTVFPDSGAVEVWDLPQPTRLYCTGKTNSLGCVPFLSFSGTAATSGSGGFWITGWNLIAGEPGFLLYGFAKANLGFHGGTLCVKAPFRRLLPPKAAPPFGPQPCDGLLERNFNTRIQSGADPLLTAGQRVFAQWRARDPGDPAGFGDALTDAVRFTICP